MEEAKTNSTAGKSVSFWNGVKSEFSKIIWPTKEKLTRQSVAVVVITVITAALIAVLDRGLQYGINFVIK
ncbi:MAG: preprotein translocase subunit SecE [Lachnospiraceae bacterium]|jgi:preprotein translocase subunit SecE|nr:preprotein translocase subunit SecE [Lachnospiraceae bacterium]MBQ2452891.1 preprotein translocase subunit SecE [Lachnospiraceae bacterium]